MDRQRLESRLFEYISKCKTYDPKNRSIETADLPGLCKYFNLDYRECSNVLTPDSRGHVTLPELVHLAIRDNYSKSSGTYWGRGQSPTRRNMAYHHPSSSRNNIPPSLLHTPAIAFDTEGSFSPPPDRFTPEEGVPNPYLTRPPSHSAPDSRIPAVSSPPDTTDMDAGRRSMSKGPDYESHPHWAMVGGPDSSMAMNAPPIGPSSHGQWTDQPPDDSDLDVKYRYRSQHPAPPLNCQQCKHWMRRFQEMEDRFVHMRREKDRVDLQLDRTQKELQQANDYYSAYQMAVKDRDRYRGELRRLRDGVDSDGSRGMERHYEDLRRQKDELELNLKQYRKHYNILKDDHDQLKRKCQDLERHQWTLIDEKQRLSTQLLRRDSLPSRYLGDGASDPSSQQSGRYSVKGPNSHRLAMMRTSSIGEHEFDLPVKDVPSSKARSMKSAPSEASEGTQYTMGSSVPTEGTQAFLVLGEDVSSSVLPDNFSQEQQLQIIYALMNCHSVQELIRCLVSYGLSPPDNQAQELQVENDLLRAKLKHMDAKNKTLTGSFENAKADSEAMFQKMSKVEANNCRLRHAMLLCRQAYSVQKVLYDMRVLDGHGGGAGSSFSPPIYGVYGGSSDRNDSAGVRNLLVNQARTLLHELESNQELQVYLPTTQTYESSHGKTGWMSITQDTGTTSGLSCVSSVGGEGELSSSESEQLGMHSQALIKYSNHLLDTLSEVDGLKGLVTLKEPCNTKDCSSSIGDPVGGKVVDIEESANTEEVCKVREEKAEMRSQIYMMEQSKRSMELQVSKIQLHGRMMEKTRGELQVVLQMEKRKRQRLKEKLKMLKVENPHMPDWTEQSAEIQSALEREREAVQRYEDLFRYMQSHVQDSQDVNSQLVEFVRELLRANRALVEAFEKARKRQQVEKKQMRHEMIQLYNRTLSNVHLPANDPPIS